MKKKLIMLFCVLAVFLLPIYSVFAEDYDEEDIIEEEQEYKGKDHASRKKKHQKRTKDQMKQWLKQLESLKNTREEASLLQITRQILSQDPDNIQALSTLGVFYLQNEKMALAKIIFRRALKKHPKNSSLHNNLAVIALKEDKKEEAVKAFKKSLEYRYSNYSAAANLGTFYMHSYEYGLAVDYLSLAYSRAKKELSIKHPDVVNTGNNYAVALAWNQDFRKAEDIFDELTENNPSMIALLLNYAILLGENMDEKEKAIRFLQKADMLDKSGSYTRKIKALKKYFRQTNS